MRIDPEGTAIDVDLPDVDVAVNEKANLDVDAGIPYAAFPPLFNAT